MYDIYAWLYNLITKWMNFEINSPKNKHWVIQAGVCNIYYLVSNNLLAKMKPLAPLMDVLKLLKL